MIWRMRVVNELKWKRQADLPSGLIIYWAAPQHAVQLFPQHAWQPPAAVQLPLGQLLPHEESLDVEPQQEAQFVPQQASQPPADPHPLFGQLPPHEDRALPV